MTLSPEFIKQQKDALLVEKKSLEDGLGNIATKDAKLEGDFDATFPDYGRTQEDNATEEEEYSSRVGIENSLEIKLRDVNAALKDIEENKYGVCEKCGTGLEEERLSVMPSARHCVKCK